MIVTKQAAKTRSTCDWTIRIADLFLRVEKAIAKALMVPFVVVVPHEFVDSSAQRVLAKEDHAIKTAFLDCAYISFGVGVQVRRAGRQAHRLNAFLFQEAPKFHRENRIAIHDQVTCAQQEPVKRIGDVPGNLLDPIRVWIGRDSGNMYSSG